MRGKLELDPDGRFIRAEFEEDATIADWYECQELLATLVDKSGIRVTLVDIRKQKAGAPTLELFKFASGLPKNIKFAVLARRTNDNAFVENVARNRGAVARLFFGPEEEAVKWLLRPA